VRDKALAFLTLAGIKANLDDFGWAMSYLSHNGEAVNTSRGMWIDGKRDYDADFKAGIK
jgi:hypothetical protein